MDGWLVAVLVGSGVNVGVALAVAEGVAGSAVGVMVWVGVRVGMGVLKRAILRRVTCGSGSERLRGLPQAIISRNNKMRMT